MNFQKSRRFVNDSMLPIMKTCLSNFVSAYRKHCRCKTHSLRGSWENNLKNNKILGAVFMDSSKVFDFIPQELLINKMEVYCFSEGLLFYTHT